MIYIFHVNISQITWPMIKDKLDILNIVDRSSIIKIKNLQSKRQKMCARIFLFHLLRQKFGYTEKNLFNFKIKEHGKPYISNFDTKWCFNLSHSEEIITCCFCDSGEIGIDIENKFKNIIDDFSSILSENELNLYKQNKLHVDFIKLWTIKEAIAKTHGLGLFIDLTSIDTTLILNSKIKVKNDFYYIKFIDIDPEYYCTLSTDNFQNDFKCFEISYKQII